ncbi:glutamyl-tRNA reductase [Gulosibacter molinativorax]|uniref:Glutamyl-tRNA reductase n=1 Tax=Gulosibacter molinativorax TaxID=256821 RepID=A0ABT7C9T9_9MICO|nr:glutamyl-tRNA reductase [Gulosibacter molinativorax]MDJ1371960.1 glutamyl-tRNA reductase [Gulosibacter molinativorax]QUY62676.1 Glutamyl-tRNA reductase [Gulosibacter molinativorax]
MLVCVSANHRSAGFSLLERFSSVSVTSLEELIRDSAEVVGGVVLSTCNRFEVYLDLEGPEQFAAFVPALAADFGMREDDLRAHVRVIGDSDVSSHLFSVSSGLESVALGEEEIAGQVGRALEQARDAQVTTRDLERLFQSAATASKGVKAHANLATQGRSLVSLALDLAASQVLDWSRANVVLIGTGTYAGASLKSLQDRGVGTVDVYSPSGRQHTLGERYDIREIEHGRLPEQLSSADLVITCTNTETYVLDYDQVRNARLAPGSSDGLLIVDMGLPRNVDPLVAKLDTVDLLDIETVRQHAPLEDLGATELARCIVARAATEFEQERREQKSAKALAQYRSVVQARVSEQIEKTGAEDVVAESMRKLGNALLHPTTMRIKELTREGRSDEVIAALNLLYGDGSAKVSVQAPATPSADEVRDGAQALLAAQAETGEPQLCAAAQLHLSTEHRCADSCPIAH